MRYFHDLIPEHMPIACIIVHRINNLVYKDIYKFTDIEKFSFKILPHVLPSSYVVVVSGASEWERVILPAFPSNVRMF